ncbi:hypothetical protein L2E82_14672 [Cichorium intybus]|uniref:Uncharacterized protein n=1 Tax=Cichorium intybus TaxID=13427 RepID=A0ACB9F126_CICIN|nr:hypothetical protein L2E82_14672 [Cichorium intybus]
MLLHRLRVCDPWFPVIPDRKHPFDFRAWKQRCGGICWGFSFVTVVDAYALIGDVSGLAEKIQSFFMQEVISETHSVLKNIVLEVLLRECP